MNKCPSLVVPLLTLLLGSGTWMAAADWYVSAADGDDLNHAGHLAYDAFRTVQKAATLAVAGDTVWIRAGTYREAVVPANSGTSGNPIVFRSYGTDAVTISGADPLAGLTWTQEGTSRIWSAVLPVGAMALGNQNQVFVDGQALVLARWPNLNADLDQGRRRFHAFYCNFHAFPCVIPGTDPYGRNYRIRLLHQVITPKR